MAESLPIAFEMPPGEDQSVEVEKNVRETLDFMDLHGVKGTFFVLGNLGRDLPHIVREIAERGHEVASHSFEHRRLYNMQREQIQDALIRSRKVLEDVSGSRVRGFRAPDFSINDQTMYILDLIRDAGYEYDSSIYPIRGHDVYGACGIGRWIQRLPNDLVEYPLSTAQVWGWRIPALGGGYFRLYPLVATQKILSRIESAEQSAIFYIHPYELGSICPSIKNLSWARRFRHYVNREKTKERFSTLFRNHSFGRIDDVLRSYGFLS